MIVIHSIAAASDHLSVNCQGICRVSPFDVELYVVTPCMYILQVLIVTGKQMSCCLLKKKLLVKCQKYFKEDVEIDCSKTEVKRLDIRNHKLAVYVKLTKHLPCDPRSFIATHLPISFPL